MKDNNLAKFGVVAKSINDTIRANHYRPIELETNEYKQIEKSVIDLGETALSSEEFLTGFRNIWEKGPFSHVALMLADEPAEERIKRGDTWNAGRGATTLSWVDDKAILTLNTMSGMDTIENIEASYDEIAERTARKLIIDLRRNDGGSFAVVPLIGHLINESIDAGVFVSHLWYKDHDMPPNPEDFISAIPWRGYSVRKFLSDMTSRPLTSYRIDPMQPLFKGPVFVLTSAISISAAEIAIDALKSINRATIIGEKTPGILLSSGLFDIPGGFWLRLPIADYYSIRNGRIEGVGIEPDIHVKADQALKAAVSL